MFYLSKNHERDLKSAIMVASVTPVLNEVQLVRLHGKLSIKASNDMTLNVFTPDDIGFAIMDKSVFTLYKA